MKITKATLVKIIKEELGELEFPSAEASEESPQSIAQGRKFNPEVLKQKLEQFQAALPLHHSHLKQLAREILEFDRYTKSVGILVPGDKFYDDLHQIRIAVLDVAEKLEKMKPREILDPPAQPPGRPGAGHLAHAGQYVIEPGSGRRLYAKSGPKGNK